MQNQMHHTMAHDIGMQFFDDGVFFEDLEQLVLAENLEDVQEGWLDEAEEKWDYPIPDENGK